MDKIFVDTALLAVPNYAIDGISAQLLVDRIGHFATLALPEMPFELVIARDAEAILWSQNCGPGFEEISNFLEVMDIASFYSASDLLQQYQSVLSRSSRSDKSCDLEVGEHTLLSVQPPLPLNLFPAAMQAETERTFATLVALEGDQSRWSVGSAFDTGSALTTFYDVEVDVNSLLHGGTRRAPFRSRGVVRTVVGIRSFFSEWHARRLWETAEASEDLYLSIVSGAWAMLEMFGQQVDYSRLEKFSIGSEFLSSLGKVQAAGTGRFSGAARLLCTQIVARQCQRHIGAFGRPNQVVRADGALGCRVHVTEGNEGLRLMFWRSNNQIEFANVGVKKELVIETGTPSEAKSIDLTDLL